MARRSQRGDRDARAALIRSNLRLVMHIARPFFSESLSRLDLIQEGNQGLVRAVDGFDPERGHRLATYAGWWIRKAIRLGIQNQGRTIRLPPHLHDRLQRARQLERDWTQDTGRSPQIEEIAALCGVEPKTLAANLRAGQATLSLNRSHSDSNEELAERIPCDASEDPEASATQKIQSEEIQRLLAQIRPRDAEMIRLRFGLGNHPPHTYEEIGERYGLTRERTRQLVRRGLKELFEIESEAEAQALEHRASSGLLRRPRAR